MKKEEIAVIIPCGGIGKRLNLPYPKPLLMLNYNKALIDYSFDLILKCPFQIRVIVILNKENLQVVEYLEKYKDKFKIVFIYQESGLTEMIGAVKSAQDLFYSIIYYYYLTQLLKQSHLIKILLVNLYSYSKDKTLFLD